MHPPIKRSSFLEKWKERTGEGGREIVSEAFFIVYVCYFYSIATVAWVTFPFLSFLFSVNTSLTSCHVVFRIYFSKTYIT